MSMALSPRQEFTRGFARDRIALAAFWVLCLLLLAAIAAPLITPQNPYDLAQLDILDSKLAPGAKSAARARESVRPRRRTVGSASQVIATPPRSRPGSWPPRCRTSASLPTENTWATGKRARRLLKAAVVLLGQTKLVQLLVVVATTVTRSTRKKFLTAILAHHCGTTARFVATQMQ